MKSDAPIIRDFVSEEGSALKPRTQIRRVLIIGGSGYLGSALCLGLRDHFQVTGTFNKHTLRMAGVASCALDTLEGTEVLSILSRYNPDIVVYASGLTKAHICEANDALAEALNVKLIPMVLKSLPKPIPFVYLSGDMHFGLLPKEETADGGTRPIKNHLFHEKDSLYAVNVIGKNKAQAEKIVMAKERLTFVIRMPLIYGESLGSAYAPRIAWLKRMQTMIENEESYPVINDQIRSSLYVGDFVRAFRMFLKKLPHSSQLFHFSAGDKCTAFDIAHEYCKRKNLDTDLLKGMDMESYFEKQKWTHSEIKYSPLSAAKFKKVFDFQAQPYQEGIQEMLERYRTGFLGDWL